MCAQKLGNFRVERAKNVTRPPTNGRFCLEIAPF